MTAAPCPEIATYELRSYANPRAPATKAPRWLAKYVDGGMLLPPTFEGATELEVTSRARQFWDSEQIALAKARTARRAAA